MSKKPGLPMITVQQADPETLAQLSDGARRNRRAMNKKQKYDAARVRVRFDVPEQIKQLLDEQARGLRTSTNDLGTFLVTVGLIALLGGDELREQIEFNPSNSPSKTWEIDLSGLLERLAEIVAKTKTGPSLQNDAPSSGATGGATDWGDWLKPSGADQ